MVKNFFDVVSYLYVDCTLLFFFSPALNQVVTLRMAYPQQTLYFEFKHHFSEFRNFLIFLPNKGYIFAMANNHSASFLIGKSSQDSNPVFWVFKRKGMRVIGLLVELLLWSSASFSFLSLLIITQFSDMFFFLSFQHLPFEIMENASWAKVTH